MTSEVTVSVGEPRDRLGRLADAALVAIETHAEASGEERVIVMLMDEGTGMVGLHGYDATQEATGASVDLFLHLAVMFKAQGKKLQLMDENGVLLL